MYKIGQKVLVGNEIGVIHDISIFGEITGYEFFTDTAYFVRVKSWDKGTNGGRWMPIGHFRPAPEGVEEK